MKVSVFTDIRFTENHSPTGVGKHIEQMVLGLSKIDGNLVSVLATCDQIEDFKLRAVSSLASLPVKRLPLPWKAAEAMWTVSGGPSVDRYCVDSDWVYCPKNDFIPLRSKKLAVTIHGAAELDPKVPQEGGVGARLNRLRRRLSYARIVARADLILTVSEFLKMQIVDWFKCDEARIAVVGNGVEQHFFDAASLPIGITGRRADRPVLLCVGGLNDIDGGDRVIKVARLLARRCPDFIILVAGNQHEKKYIDEAKLLPNIELLGFVETSHLACYMRDSLALLFMTRYETFGIAAAEAMAVGTPVITCGGTAVPEVVGNAGIYVSDNPEDVLDKILEISRNRELTDSIRLAGKNRASEYTWSSCVRKLNAAMELRL